MRSQRFSGSAACSAAQTRSRRTTSLCPAEGVRLHDRGRRAEVYLRFAVLDGYYLYRAPSGSRARRTACTARCRVSKGRDTHRRVLRLARDLSRQVRDRDSLPANRSGRHARAEPQAAGLRRSRHLLHPAELEREDQAARGARRDARAGPVRARAKEVRGVAGRRRDRRSATRRSGVRAERALDPINELTVGWQIAPVVSYRDWLSFRADGKISSAARRCRRADPLDENFGDVEVYYDYVEAKFRSHVRAQMRSTSLTAGFQGCRDNSVCYPPSEQTMALVPATSGSGPTRPRVASAGEPVWARPRRRIVKARGGRCSACSSSGLALSLHAVRSADGADPVDIIASQTEPCRRAGSCSHPPSSAWPRPTAAGALAALAGGQIRRCSRNRGSSVCSRCSCARARHVRLFELQMPTASNPRRWLANRQRGGTFIGVAVWARGLIDNVDHASRRLIGAHRDRADRQRRSRIERTVRDEHGLGSPCSWSALRRAAVAAGRTMDGDREGGLRRADGRRRDLDARARATRLNCSCSGRCSCSDRRVPRRVRALPEPASEPPLT